MYSRWLSASLPRPVARSYRVTLRTFSASSEGSAEDLRQTLLNELKRSMKQKDAMTSLTLRSVLADVYSADKNSNGAPVDGKTIQQLLRKAVARRTDAAKRFKGASRADLAAKEQAEVSVLEKFLPAMLPEDELENALQDVIEKLVVPQGSDPRKHLGEVFKTLYARVDKTRVNHELVKEKAASMLLRRTGP